MFLRVNTFVVFVLVYLGFSASRVPAEGALGLNAAPEDGEEEEEEEEEKDGELTEEARARRTRREAHWRSMFNIRLQDNRERKYESELLLEAAENLGGLLREQVTLPPDREDATRAWTDIHRGGHLPAVTCAFSGCTWYAGAEAISAEKIRQFQEHPWDRELREHVLTSHRNRLIESLGPAAKCNRMEQANERQVNELLYDVYLQALAVREREGIPVHGPSIQRRIIEYTQQVYNDSMIRALVCCLCARIRVDTGRHNSDINFVHGGWFLQLPRGSFKKNFSKREFADRYQQEGSPLSEGGHRVPDFSDWLLTLSPELLANAEAASDAYQLGVTPLLCCPEDHRCKHTCVEDKRLCASCELPVCRECRIGLQANIVVPIGLINDNWYGYVDRFIYEQQVTWMEMTCATPFWTGMMLMEIEVRRGERSKRKKHKLHDPLFAPEGRIAYKGQLFSAPMDWRNIIEQLQLADLWRDTRVQSDGYAASLEAGRQGALSAELKDMQQAEKYISLPVTGAILAQRVRVVVAAGLVDLNKLLKQATIRRDIVVQLIRMHRDGGHPDYQRGTMEEVELKALQLAADVAGGMEPAVPDGIVGMVDGEENAEEPFLGVDKPATPAERIFSESNLEREMRRTRPQILVPQRDSDANKDVEGSRMDAFSGFSDLKIQTGSVLEKQFETSYMPRVFNVTLPWCVGGPDFPRKERFRRRFDEASPAVDLDTWTALMACRCESQMRHPLYFGGC